MVNVGNLAKDGAPMWIRHYLLEVGNFFVIAVGNFMVDENNKPSIHADLIGFQQVLKTG